ncbi:MAG TPA: PEGA domain-containing protein [Spirochaetia bacterium]|nr:PEGA domain-containing protein [Spirochaetia bacterium]
MKQARLLALLILAPLVPLAGQTSPFGQAATGAATPTATVPGTPATGAPAAPVTGTTGAPANPNVPDLSIPVDKKDTWVVGFTVFREEGLSPENQYLSSSVPLLLKNALAGVSTHTLLPEEQDLLRKAVIAREVEAAATSMTNLRQQRDAQFLDTSPPSASSLAALDARIGAAQQRRGFLVSLDISRVTVVEQKPLVVKEGTGAGKLLDPPAVPAGVFCTRNGLDFLVGGTIREVQGYILLDVWAYDALRDTVTFSYRDANLREETYSALPGIGREISGRLLGRPWSSIAFAPDPPNSSLYVDGKLAATGKTPALYLSPGAREIRVSAPGYLDLSRTVTLGPEEETSLDITLEKEQGGNLVISSTPPGANVYIESVWKGKTPLALEKPFERTRVLLSANGFYDQAFSISAGSPSELTFTLLPDSVSRDAIQKKARDDFYASFTWFALTLPIPFFSYAFALDEAVRVTQLGGSGPQAAQAQALGNALYWGGYVGGTVLSVSLFTWMVIKIIYYVSVSTRTAG